MNNCDLNYAPVNNYTFCPLPHSTGSATVHIFTRFNTIIENWDKCQFLAVRWHHLHTSYTVYCNESQCTHVLYLVDFLWVMGQVCTTRCLQCNGPTSSPENCNPNTTVRRSLPSEWVPLNCGGEKVIDLRQSSCTALVRITKRGTLVPCRASNWLR